MKKLLVIVTCFLLVAAGCTDRTDSSFLDYKSDTIYKDESIVNVSEEDDDSEYQIQREAATHYFNGYECTQDCSGHEAGYEWAEDNDIEDENDCGGNSNSFIEGCLSYVEEANQESEEYSEEEY